MTLCALIAMLIIALIAVCVQLRRLARQIARLTAEVRDVRKRQEADRGWKGPRPRTRHMYLRDFLPEWTCPLTRPP